MADKSSIVKSKTNAEIRNWYLETVARIPVLNEDWIKQGLSPLERAQKAWLIRHEARLKARSMMRNPTEVKLLQERDIAEYGNPDGPTFDFLIEENRKLGLVGDSIYEAIIDESYRTNIGVNKELGLK